MHDIIENWCKTEGYTDETFIEGARFGAMRIIRRMVADQPQKEEELFKQHSCCSIWRNVDERPKDGSTRVLRNGAMISYAYYDKKYCYLPHGDAAPFLLNTFAGQWCYKADMFGVSITAYDFYNNA